MRLGLFWESWGLFGRLRWTIWAHFESFGGHWEGSGGPFGLVLGGLGLIREALVGHLGLFWKLWGSFFASSGQLFKLWSENRKYHENLVFLLFFQWFWGYGKSLLSLDGHSGDPGEPFGLILGALGVVREALVDRLDSCWELWGSFGRP